MVEGGDTESAATFGPTFLMGIGTSMAAWSKDILARLEPAEQELSQVVVIRCLIIDTLCIHALHTCFEI